MKQATQTALIGAIINTAMSPISMILYKIFDYNEFLNTTIQTIHFLCGLTLVNFFYKLYQKQNLKTDKIAAKIEFKE